MLSLYSRILQKKAAFILYKRVVILGKTNKMHPIERMSTQLFGGFGERQSIGESQNTAVKAIKHLIRLKV